MPKRALVALVSALLLTGCTSQSAPAPGAVQTAPQPPATTSPAPAQPVTSGPAPSQPAPATSQPGAKQLVVPLPKPGEGIQPVDLRVSADGKIFALWRALQADGLIAWREGDSQSVALSGNARRDDVAFSPSGIYFVHVTAPLDGRPQIRYYQWADQKMEVVVDSDQLAGYPRSLTYDSKAGLIFSDDQGMKVLDGKELRQWKGPAILVTQQGNAMATRGFRYVTTVGDKLVLATANQVETTPLADLGNKMLTRVSWFENGEADRSFVAVELSDGPKGGGSAIKVFAVPAEGASKEILTAEGSEPVLFADRVYYRAGGAVMEQRLDAKQAQQVSKDAGHLAGDVKARRVYLLNIADPSGKVPYLEVK